MKTLRRFLFSVLIAISAGNLGLAGVTLTKGQLSDSDYQLIRQVAHQGNFEIILAEIGSERSTNPVIQAFARQLVADRQKANASLAQVLDQKGAVVGDYSTVMDRQVAARLNGNFGVDFDNAYKRAISDEATAASRVFQNAADKIADADLKKWVIDNTALWQKHVEAAQDPGVQSSPTGL